MGTSQFQPVCTKCPRSVNTIESPPSRQASPPPPRGGPGWGVRWLCASYPPLSQPAVPPGISPYPPGRAEVGRALALARPIHRSRSAPSPQAFPPPHRGGPGWGVCWPLRAPRTSPPKRTNNYKPHLPRSLCEQVSRCTPPTPTTLTPQPTPPPALWPCNCYSA
jgi:hypothetical protein